MNKAALLFLTALFLATASGCYFTSDHPVTAKKSIKEAESLLGIWQVKNDGQDHKENEDGWLIILKDKKELLRFIIVDDKYGYEESYQGYLSKSGNKLILNVMHVTETGEAPGDPGYLFVLAEAANDKLRLSLLNEELIEKSIRGGRLKGMIKKGQFAEEIRLTASSREIAEFIKKVPVEQLRDTVPLLKGERKK